MTLLDCFVLFIFRSRGLVIRWEGDHQQAAQVPQAALSAGQQQPEPRDPGLPGELGPRPWGQQQHLTLASISQGKLARNTRPGQSFSKGQIRREQSKDIGRELLHEYSDIHLNSELFTSLTILSLFVLYFGN